MMPLIAVTFQNVLIGILCFSLAILILIISYRKLLAYLGKGVPPKEDYCVLYSMESEEVDGEGEIYFTSERERNVIVELLNTEFVQVKEVYNKDCKKGGNIVRFETHDLADGNYFYQLITDNQKTLKKMRVKNARN